MRILLIDDEPGVTENIALYLEDGFHQVEALNYVDNEKHLQEMLKEFDPEGVILDYDMVPRGFGLYEWIRRWNDAVPIVFYTKYARSPWHHEKMIETGARSDQIIQKVEAAADVPRILRALKDL